MSSSLQHQAMPFYLLRMLLVFCSAAAQQSTKAPPPDLSVCEQDELWNRLNSSMPDAPGCRSAWPEFLQTLESKIFIAASVEDQNKVLRDFCRSRCSGAFDRILDSWKRWCAGDDGKWNKVSQPKRRDSKGQAISMRGPIILFGCARPLGLLRTADYCALSFSKLANHAVNSTDEVSCRFYQTCCLGEASRFIRGEFIPANCLGTQVTKELTCFG